MAVAGNYEGGGDKPEESGKQVNDQVTWSTTEGGCARVCHLNAQTRDINNNPSRGARFIRE